MLATLAFVALIRSPAGRCMVAIRDNETLAESLGMPTWTYKLIVFMLSAAFAGLGGSLYAHFSTVVSPLVFQMYYSNTILIIVLGGGVGTDAGRDHRQLRLRRGLRGAAHHARAAHDHLRLRAAGLVFLFPQGLAPLFQRAAERICAPRPWRRKEKRACRLNDADAAHRRPAQELRRRAALQGVDIEVAPRRGDAA